MRLTALLLLSLAMILLILTGNGSSQAANLPKCGTPEARTSLACVIYMPDPVDVSAVPEKRKECVRYSNFSTGWGGPACVLYDMVPHETCTDKTRILEHDEQDPPKYWCRKVQP